MSARTKIKIEFSQESVVESKIDMESVAESQTRILTAMKLVVREYQKNEAISKQHASRIVLNA